MNHIVHKLVLDLRFPSEEKSPSVLNYRIDHEYRDEIVRVIQEVLEKVPQHVNLFIEKIELDIHGSDPETLIREVKEQLDAHLQQALERFRIQPSDPEFNPHVAPELKTKTENFTPQDAEAVWTVDSLRLFLEKGRFRWETQKLILQQTPGFVYECVRRSISQNRTEWVLLFAEKPAAFLRFLHYFKESRDDLFPHIANHFTVFKTDILALLQYLAQLDPARLATLESDGFGGFLGLLKIESPSQTHSLEAVAVLLNLIAKLDQSKLKKNTQSGLLIDRKIIEELAAKGIHLSPEIRRMVEESSHSATTASVQGVPKTVEIPTDLVVKNAGILLLHPFLQPFFDEFRLLSNHKFGNKLSQLKAIQLLHYLATFQLSFNEDETAFYKILCGLPIDEPVFPSWKLTRKAKKACRELVQEAINHWEALKNTSPEVVQSEFLQRSGTLSSENAHYRVAMEKKSIDILLQRLPWGIGVIKLPWVEKLIVVQWD